MDGKYIFTISFVTKLILLLLQGRNKRGSSAWVSHYHVSYSEDAYSWEWARDIYGDKKVLYQEWTGCI